MNWLVGGFLAGMLLAITIIDAREQRIPDLLSLPLIPAGLLASGSLLHPGMDYVVAPERILAALAAGGLLWALARAYEAWRGFAGLGMGDVKLTMAAAAWLAPQQLAPWLLASCASALLWALALRKKGHERLPFGSFLAPWMFVFWLLA